jgi:hypothetical protein
MLCMHRFLPEGHPLRGELRKLACDASGNKPEATQPPPLQRLDRPGSRGQHCQPHHATRPLGLDPEFWIRAFGRAPPAAAVAEASDSDDEAAVEPAGEVPEGGAAVEYAQPRGKRRRTEPSLVLEGSDDEGVGDEDDPNFDPEASDEEVEPLDLTDFGRLSESEDDEDSVRPAQCETGHPVLLTTGPSTAVNKHPSFAAGSMCQYDGMHTIGGVVKVRVCSVVCTVLCWLYFG